MIFNFRQKKFFWKYFELNEFRNDSFNLDSESNELKVIKAGSRIHNFLFTYKYYKPPLIRTARHLFDHLVLSKRIQSNFPTRLNIRIIIECGEFDRL